MSARAGIVAIASTSVTLVSIAAAGCTETVRGAYDGPPDAVVNLPPGDAGPGEAAPSTADAAPPDLASPKVACADAGPCALELVNGREHFCARLADGTVRCWGGDILLNGYPAGSLGALPPADADAGADAAPFGSRPLRVPGLPAAVQISAAGNDTCARDGDGGVRCWGDNGNAQLGSMRPVAMSDQNPHPAPVAAAVPEPATHVDVSEDAVCVRTASGSTWCWGYAYGYDLLRPRTDESTPIFAPAPTPFPAALGAIEQVVIGRYSGVARTGEGRLVSWGSASSPGAPGGHLRSYGGIFGRVSSLPFDPQPNAIETGGRVVGLSASKERACAVIVKRGRDGKELPASELRCWGSNEAGELGNGGTGGYQNTDDLPTLAPLPERVFPQQSSSSRYAMCTRTTEGAVYCAGINASGRLGRPAIQVGSAVLVEVPGVTSAAHVATGGSTSCALLTSGSVVCWGSNELGQLGLGTQDDLAHPTPTKVVFQ